MILGILYHPKRFCTQVYFSTNSKVVCNVRAKILFIGKRKLYYIGKYCKNNLKLNFVNFFKSCTILYLMIIFCLIDFNKQLTNSWWLWYLQRQGCIHGEELSYVFGAPLVSGMMHFPRNYTKAEVLLSEATILYWSNFARTGYEQVYPTHTLVAT